MKEKENILHRIIASPVYILLAVVVFIFVADIVVFLIISTQRHPITFSEIVINSALLLVLILTILYFFVFRQLTARITERKQMEDKLKVLRELDRNIITHTLDYDEVFETATNLINKIVQCDRVTIVLVDEEREGFLYCYGWVPRYERRETLYPSGRQTLPG